VAAKPAEAEPKYGGVATFAHRRDPPFAFDTLRTTTLDLHHIGGGLNGNGSLVRPCRGDVYKVCGGVAQSWESTPDFTQWTFKVRDVIKWHDGTLFTAEDAKFWVELAAFGAKVGDKVRGPASFASVFSDLKKVEVLDGNRLRLTLERSQPQFLYEIGVANRSIAHPSHLMKPLLAKGQVDVSPQDVGFVSIGPFKMLKYERGIRAQVRRNDLYWETDAKGRKLPYLEGIEFAFIRDPSAMDAAFRVGRLEGGARGAGYNLSPERKDGYVRDLGDQVWFYETPTTRSGIGFNVIHRGPLQDVRIRKAISLWMDRQAALKVEGFARPSALLGPDSPFTTPDYATWPGYNTATREKDRAEAKRLMAEAGHPTGGFQLTFPCRRIWITFCEYYHGQFAGLGIDLKLILQDDAAWAADRLKADHEVIYGGEATSYIVIPEAAENGLTRFSITRYAQPKHEDPKVAGFFDRLRTATNFEERVKIHRELERYMLLDQVYLVQTHQTIGVVAYRSYVKGLVVPLENDQNDTDFATVWLDK
jgi:ABC-type transport system substrate-binding protein